MQGLNTARFFEKRGRQIDEFGGAYWFSVEKRMMMPLPLQLDLSLERREAASFLSRRNLAGLRYSSSTHPGFPGGMYVIRDKNYSLTSLDSRQRRNVKKGLEATEIRLVPAEDLLAHGIQMNTETMKRQGRFELEYADPKQWERLVRAIEESPCAYVLGAYVDGRLAAYSIHVVEDGWGHLLHQFSSAELLPTRANHALCFEAIAQCMRRDDVEAYCGGLSSLVHLQGLHEFKLLQGYAYEPRKTVCQLHPLLDATLASRLGHSVARHAKSSYPDDQRIHRIATVIEAAWMSKQSTSLNETPTEEVLAR